MTKIFISHASEDKVTLADELAHSLKAKYLVWYDSFELTAGDSLLGKINEGLSSCDYGVVILSPAFFLKKWTRSELDGLMAIETANRKVILPIWLNVSEDEVKAASPILAGRLGIDGKLPLNKVVEEIQRAIEVADRVSSFPRPSPVIEKLRDLAKKHEGLKRAEVLAHSEEGVSVMRSEVDSFRNTLKEQVVNLSAAFPKSEFRSDFNKHGSLEVFGPHGVFLVVHFVAEYSNSLTGACLRYKIGVREMFSHSDSYLEGVILRPSFSHLSSLEWTDPEGVVFSTDLLGETMLNRFIEEIETVQNDKRLKSLS